MHETLDITAKAKLAEYCRKNCIRRLSFFGSRLRGDFRPDSDLDVLVEFEPGYRIGLRYFEIENELSEFFGRKVDLNTPNFLSPDFRDNVVRNAEVQYGPT